MLQQPKRALGDGSRIRPPKAYDQFDDEARNDWLDALQYKIRYGLNPPAEHEAGPSRSPSPPRQQVSEESQADVPELPNGQNATGGTLDEDEDEEVEEVEQDGENDEDEWYDQDGGLLGDEDETIGVQQGGPILAPESVTAPAVQAPAFAFSFQPHSPASRPRPAVQAAVAHVTHNLEPSPAPAFFTSAGTLPLHPAPAAPTFSIPDDLLDPELLATLAQQLDAAAAVPGISSVPLFTGGEEYQDVDIDRLEADYPAGFGDASSNYDPTAELHGYAAEPYSDYNTEDSAAYAVGTEDDLFDPESVERFDRNDQGAPGDDGEEADEEELEEDEDEEDEEEEEEEVEEVEGSEETADSDGGESALAAASHADQPARREREIIELLSDDEDEDDAGDESRADADSAGSRDEEEDTTEEEDELDEDHVDHGRPTDIISASTEGTPDIGPPVSDEMQAGTAESNQRIEHEAEDDLTALDTPPVSTGRESEAGPLASQAEPLTSREIAVESTDSESGMLIPLYPQLEGLPAKNSPRRSPSNLPSEAGTPEQPIAVELDTDEEDEHVEDMRARGEGDEQVEGSDDGDAAIHDGARETDWEDEEDEAGANVRDAEEDGGEATRAGELDAVVAEEGDIEMDADGRESDWVDEDGEDDDGGDRTTVDGGSTDSDAEDTPSPVVSAEPAVATGDTGETPTYDGHSASAEVPSSPSRPESASPVGRTQSSASPMPADLGIPAPSEAIEVEELDAEPPTSVGQGALGVLPDVVDIPGLAVQSFSSFDISVSDAQIAEPVSSAGRSNADLPSDSAIGEAEMTIDFMADETDITQSAQQAMGSSITGSALDSTVDVSDRTIGDEAITPVMQLGSIPSAEEEEQMLQDLTLPNDEAKHAPILVDSQDHTSDLATISSTDADAAELRVEENPNHASSSTTTRRSRRASHNPLLSFPSEDEEEEVMQDMTTEGAETAHQPIMIDNDADLPQPAVLDSSIAPQKYGQEAVSASTPTAPISLDAQGTHGDAYPVQTDASEVTMGFAEYILQPPQHIEPIEPDTDVTFELPADLPAEMQGLGSSRAVSLEPATPTAEVDQTSASELIAERPTKLPDPAAPVPDTNIQPLLQAGDMPVATRSPSMEVEPPANIPSIDVVRPREERAETPTEMPDPQAPPPDTYMRSPILPQDLAPSDHTPTASVIAQAPDEPPAMPMSAVSSGATSPRQRAETPTTLPDPAAAPPDARLLMPDVPHQIDTGRPVEESLIPHAGPAEEQEMPPTPISAGTPVRQRAAVPLIIRDFASIPSSPLNAGFIGRGDVLGEGPPSASANLLTPGSGANPAAISPTSEMEVEFAIDAEEGAGFADTTGVEAIEIEVAMEGTASAADVDDAGVEVPQDDLVPSSCQPSPSVRDLAIADADEIPRLKVEHSEGREDDSASAGPSLSGNAVPAVQDESSKSPDDTEPAPLDIETGDTTISDPEQDTADHEPLRHHHGADSEHPPETTIADAPTRRIRHQARASISTEPAVTRSHCGYRQIRITEDDLAANVLVPQCVLSDVDRMEQEEAADVGAPTTDDEKEARKQRITHNDPQLHAVLSAKLHRIVGSSIFDGGHCFLLSASPGGKAEDEARERTPVATPRRSKPRSSIAGTPGPGLLVPGSAEALETADDAGSSRGRRRSARGGRPSGSRISDAGSPAAMAISTGPRRSTRHTRSVSRFSQVSNDQLERDTTPTPDTATSKLSPPPLQHVRTMPRSSSLAGSTDRESTPTAVAAEVDAPAGRTRARSVRLSLEPQPELEEQAESTDPKLSPAPIVTADDIDAPAGRTRAKSVRLSLEPELVPAEPTAEEGSDDVSGTIIVESTPRKSARSKGKAKAEVVDIPHIDTEDEPASESVLHGASTKPRSKRSPRKFTAGRGKEDEAPYRPSTPEIAADEEDEDDDAPLAVVIPLSPTRKTARRNVGVKVEDDGEGLAGASSQPALSGEADTVVSPPDTGTRKRKNRLSTLLSGGSGHAITPSKRETRSTKRKIGEEAGGGPSSQAEENQRATADEAGGEMAGTAEAAEQPMPKKRRWGLKGFFGR